MITINLTEEQAEYLNKLLNNLEEDKETIADQWFEEGEYEKSDKYYYEVDMLCKIIETLNK